MKSALIWLVALTLSLPDLSAQVMLNEFSAANYSLYNFGDEWNPQFKDWIEIYNAGDELDISGYYLSDDINDPLKWAFPNGTIIGAGEHMLVACGGWNAFEIDYPLVTNFGITQTDNEAITFSDAEGFMIEGYEFWGSSVLKADHSLARGTDGDDIWWTCSEPTPGTSNGGQMGTNFAFAPQFSHEAGHYAEPIMLELDPWSDSHTIYYTLDGSEPTEESTAYTVPIAIEQTTVLKILVVSSDELWLPGFIRTNTYFINVEPHTLPIVSISGPELSDGEWENEIRHLTDCEIFDTEFNRISISHGESDEHGADANAFNQRGFDYIVRDSRGYEHEIEIPLFASTERDHFKRLIFRAAGSDNFPYSQTQSHIKDALCQILSHNADLNIDSRSCEHCVVYINGEYWGIYEMREKVDDIDYFQEYYNADPADVTFLKTWGGTWAEYGMLEDWNDITGMVEAGEFCWEPTYNDVGEVLDVNSVIDFFILNSFVVNAGWLNWDQAWWRAVGDNPVKWRYALWDLDQTLGDAINFTGIPDMTATASPCDFQSLLDPGGQGHIPLVNALFENPDFEAAFHDRYMDLIDGPFSCSSMQVYLDSLRNVLLPEMPRHVDRWAMNDETVETWEEAFDQVETFLMERCEVIEGLVDDCWDGNANEGGWSLTIEIENDGLVDINDFIISPDNSPYIFDEYNCDILLDLLAIDGTDGFIEWEVIEGNPDIGNGLDPSISFEVDEDIHVLAVFESTTHVAESNPLQFQAFPNPAEDVLNIRADMAIASLQILDLSGRVVHGISPNASMLTIDVASLSSGAYHVVGNMAGERFSTLFFKR